MRGQFQPDGAELSLQAAFVVYEKRRTIADLEARLAEVQTQLADAKVALATAEQRHRDTLAVAGCSDDLHSAPAPVRVTGALGGPASAAKPMSPGPSPADDVLLAIVWRLGWHILEAGVLDYGIAAERIWGPGVTAAAAKNRISTHLGYLKKAGVITDSLGHNRFAIDRAKLAEKSKRPMPEASP